MYRATNIELHPSRRKTRTVWYYLTVRTPNIPSLEMKLRKFEIDVRETAPIGENAYRLRAAVCETQFVGAEFRLDRVLPLLAETHAGFAELKRERIKDGAVREIEFLLDVESANVGPDVATPLRSAGGISVKDIRDLPGGDRACKKCWAADLKLSRAWSHMQAPDGGPVYVCQTCGAFTGCVPKPRYRIQVGAVETPEQSAVERLNTVLSAIRNNARLYRELSLSEVSNASDCEHPPELICA